MPRRSDAFPICAALALTACTLGVPALAADDADPTWPCVQRKAPELSLGLMWATPVPDDAVPEDRKSAADALAARLALRRVPEADLPPLIADFVAANGADRDLLGAVFAHVFRTLSRTRTAVMGGIERYSLDQIALSKRIDAARDEMDRIAAEAEPDFDRMDALEEQIDWDERIYDDRRRSLTYVCETPVLIEKRLYAVAQMLAAAAQD